MSASESAPPASPSPSHTAHPTLPALLSSLRPRFPQGSDNAPIPAAASTGEAALSETATELQAIGMDALEIAKFPDFPSIFERINAMQASLEKIAALLEASLRKPPIYEAVHIGPQGAAAVIHKHGRRYVGLRTQAATPMHLMFMTSTGTFEVSPANFFQYFLFPDGIQVYGKTADAGVLEFVYVDEPTNGIN